MDDVAALNEAGWTLWLNAMLIGTETGLLPMTGPPPSEHLYEA